MKTRLIPAIAGRIIIGIPAIILASVLWALIFVVSPAGFGRVLTKTGRNFLPALLLLLCSCIKEDDPCIYGTVKDNVLYMVNIDTVKVDYPDGYYCLSYRLVTADSAEVTEAKGL